jgi:coiled-coil domain-containing protein 61
LSGFFKRPVDLPFSHADISEITSKTGNFKAYPVFVKMLVTALGKSSDSVCVDLLTYSDLEVLKAKRLRRAGQDVPSRPNNVSCNNKRYLILTYQGEFDKVHYPLPLSYEEHPDPAELKQTISRLRGESPRYMWGAGSDRNGSSNNR